MHINNPKQYLADQGFLILENEHYYKNKKVYTYELCLNDDPEWPIGILSVKEENDSYFQVIIIDFDEGYQGKKLAAALSEYSLKNLAKEGKKLLPSDDYVDPKAQRIYEYRLKHPEKYIIEQLERNSTGRMVLPDGTKMSPRAFYMQQREELEGMEEDGHIYD